MANMLIVWLVMTAMVILFLPAAFFCVSAALAFGWQMGSLTERNDWNDWYLKKIAKQRKLGLSGEQEDKP